MTDAAPSKSQVMVFLRTMRKRFADRFKGRSTRAIVRIVSEENRSDTELAEVRTALSIRNSMMAADRTLMAWVRTGLSMISFGITIYKLLQGLEQAGTLPAERSPREIGLLLIGLGTVSILLGTIEYWFRLKEATELKLSQIWRPAFVMALVMSGIGFLLFIGIIVRLV